MSACVTFEGIPLFIILLEWNLVDKSTRLSKETLPIWTPLMVKLNFDVCFLRPVICDGVLNPSLLLGTLQVIWDNPGQI